jgi:prophage DNA circulation protein
VDSYIVPRLLVLADDGEDDPYLALNKARASMIKDVNTRAATLKNKKYIRTSDAMPCIVFAYDQYEDATQDTDVIRRNRIRNPVFIPPLTDVEIVV